MRASARGACDAEYASRAYRACSGYGYEWSDGLMATVGWLGDLFEPLAVVRNQVVERVLPEVTNATIRVVSNA